MAEMSLEQAYELAISQQRAGRAGDAESVFREILAQRSDHVDSLLALARLLHEAGKTDEAAGLLRQVIALRPGSAEPHGNLGTVLATQLKYDEAIEQFRQAIALKPDMAALHNNLANALRGKGDLDGAIDEYRQAIRLRPDYFDAINNLASALSDKGATDEALLHFQSAASLRPDSADAAYHLARALITSGRPDEAIASFRGALSIKPDHIDALNELVMALGNKGAIDQAISLARRAVALRPDLPLTHNDLGWVVQKRELLEEAEAEYRRALELWPQYPEAHNNLASVLWDMARFQEGLGEMHTALTLQPGYASIEANLGLMMLTLGDFEQGWRTYEARRQVIPVSLDLQETKTRWDGSNLSGKRIVIQSEQGFGDSLHFVRYLPMVHDRGGTVILQCHPSLHRLFASVRGADMIVSDTEPVPDFDVHTRLLSLPGIFGTNLQSIPDQVPYLFPDPASVKKWRYRLAGEPAGLKVGLAWAGSPTHALDRQRSLPLSALARLAQGPNVNFYSLQKGEASVQAKSPPPGMRLVDWTSELLNFADTAALVKNLDIVISVDSAVAHLAGALGVSVWVLVQFIPDWRWMLNRTDSPWYPTMRLFRQASRGNWEMPVQRMADELQSHVGH